MRIDLHCHTKYSSDNFFEPQDLIAEAFEAGLDGVCITEHDSVAASEPVENLPGPPGFLLLRGVEISTDIGHMLAFGIDDDSWRTARSAGRTIDHKTAVREIRKRGGVCIPSHPYRGLESMGDWAFQKKMFDAVETCNGANAKRQNTKARTAAAAAGMPETGGSDCHGPGEVGRAYTVFERHISDMAALVAEIKAGRFRPGSAFENN